MKITKKELKEMIKEEALKFQKKLQLESELAEIQKQLDEVEAGGETKVRSSAWTGERDGDSKFEEEFEEKSRNGGFPALKEEDESVEECGDVMEEEAVEENVDATLEEILSEIMSEEEVVAEETVNEEEVNEEVVAEEEEEVVEENLDEPIEGESVAQEVDKWDNNENMEKDKHVHESEEKDGTALLSEEQVRMQKLAGIKNIL
jgi:hypothetical protein